MIGNISRDDTPEKPARFYASKADNIGHAYGKLEDVHIEPTGSTIDISAWFESTEGFLIRIPRVEDGDGPGGEAR